MEVTRTRLWHRGGVANRVLSETSGADYLQGTPWGEACAFAGLKSDHAGRIAAATCIRRGRMCNNEGGRQI